MVVASAAMPRRRSGARLGADRRASRDSGGKGREIGREALRLLPVRGVSRALVHDESRAGAGFQKSLLIAARNQRVTIAPDEKRGLPGPRVRENALGTGCASVLSWNSRTNAGETGSVIPETADSQRAAIAGLLR